MVTINPISNPAVKAYSTQAAATKAATAPAASSPAVKVSISSQQVLGVNTSASAPPSPIVSQGQGLGARVITVSNYNPANQILIFDGATPVYPVTATGASPFSGPVVSGKTAQFTLAQANIVDPFFNPAASPPTYTPQFTVKFKNASGVLSPASIQMRNPVPIYDVTADINVKRYNDVLADPTQLPSNVFNQVSITDNGNALSRNFSTLLDMMQDMRAAGGLPVVKSINYSDLARPTLKLGVGDILKGDQFQIGSKPVFYSIKSQLGGSNPALIQPTGNFSIDEAVALSSDTVKLMKTMNIDVSADDLSPANVGQLAQKIAKLNVLFATEGSLAPGQASKFKINITASVQDVQTNIDILGRLKRLDKITLASNVDQTVSNTGGTGSVQSNDSIGFSAKADILPNANDPSHSILNVTRVGNGKLNIGDTIIINGGLSAKIIGFDTANGGIGQYILDQSYQPVQNATVISTVASTVPLTITADQYKFNTSVLNAIGNNYQLHLTGVKAVEANLMFKDPHVLDFTVEDNMSNVLANANALNKIPKNFTLAIKDTVKNVVAYSSNLGNLIKPYSLNITDASLDKVLQNSNVLSKLKVSYNLRDKTSEVISHADDLIKFTKNVTIGKSLSNWQNSSVIDTAAVAVQPPSSPFKISLTTPTPPAASSTPPTPPNYQLISIVEGSTPIDQILVETTVGGVSNYYSGLTIDKSNNILQDGRVIGAVVKTFVNNQSVTRYTLFPPGIKRTGQLAAGSTATSSEFNWLPPSTFVPSDGNHNYQLVADPSVPSSNTDFGITINGKTTTGGTAIGRSFAINVISSSVGGSNGLAPRYSSADPSFYMIHDSESALAHLDLSSASPFSTLLASGRLLGAVSADGTPQGPDATLSPPTISVPRQYDVANNKLNATLIPIIGYDRSEVSNDGIVAKFKNGLNLNGVKWTEAQLLDAQSNVEELVINSPISSIVDTNTPHVIDNTSILKSISKVLKINVQIDKNTTDDQIKSLYGVSSVPGSKVVAAGDTISFPSANPTLVINGISIFQKITTLQKYDPVTKSMVSYKALVPYDAQAAVPPINTVGALITAIQNGVADYNAFLKYSEDQYGAYPSYKSINLNVEIDQATNRLVLWSNSSPTITINDPNNIMAYTGLNFSTVFRPTGAPSGVISLSGVPVGSAPNGQVSGQVKITVSDKSNVPLAQQVVNLSLGNNPQKNITSIINAINDAFGYNGSTTNTNYVLRATSDGTLNGGVKLSSITGDQIKVEYPNDLSSVLGVQFGAISKYLQINTLDASVLAPPAIQTALSNFPNHFTLNVIDTQANIMANQLAIDTAGRGQAKITLQN